MLRTILVLDDNPEDLNFCKRSLGGEYKIEACDNPNVLVEKAAKIHPAMILIDLNMPVIKGFEVIKKLNTANLLKDTIAVMLTESSAIDDCDEAIKLGATGCIEKPYNEKKLLSSVDSYINHYNFSS